MFILTYVWLFWNWSSVLGILNSPWTPNVCKYVQLKVKVEADWSIVLCSSYLREQSLLLYKNQNTWFDQNMNLFFSLLNLSSSLVYWLKQQWSDTVRCELYFYKRKGSKPASKRGSGLTFLNQILTFQWAV